MNLDTSLTLIWCPQALLTTILSSHWSTAPSRRVQRSDASRCVTPGPSERITVQYSISTAHVIAESSSVIVCDFILHSQWKCTVLCFCLHERHAPMSWHPPENHRNVGYFREGLPGDRTDTHNHVPTCQQMALE